jgi:hypothetical protein
MIDLVTIVFREELNFLKIQAQSIELHIQQADLGNIYVVVNDDDSVADLIDAQWWGTNHTKVQVIPYSCWNYVSRINGWENQQLCKLLAAGSAEHEWSMSLDAKTWFVQPVDLTKLFDVLDTKKQDQKTPLCLVVASDGVWDNWKFEDVTDFVLSDSVLESSNKKEKTAAELLIQQNDLYAKSNFGNSSDNATAIVVYLNRE